jgi:hypothetical protein
MSTGFVQYHCGDTTPPPATCDAPKDVQTPFFIRGSTQPNSSIVMTANCGGPAGTSGNHFAYRVHVPDGMKLRATLTLVNNGSPLPSTFAIGTSCTDFLFHDGNIPVCTQPNESPNGLGSPIPLLLEWPNTTGADVDAIVYGARLWYPSYDLRLEVVAPTETPVNCPAGEVDMEGTCEPVPPSCPVPNVLMPDGACGSPNSTASACGCGAACPTGEVCSSGTCVDPMPGETCDNPLDVDLTTGGMAPGGQVEVVSADTPVVAYPFNDGYGQLTVHGLDATARLTMPPNCHAVSVDTHGANGAPYTGWVLLEAFDESGCSGPPLATKLLAPDMLVSGSSFQVFLLPAQATRVRAQFLSPDDQGPLTISFYHYFASLCF